MASVNTSEQIAPTVLIVPSITAAKQTAYYPTGTLGISGAKLCFWTGSDWEMVTSTATA